MRWSQVPALLRPEGRLQTNSLSAVFMTEAGPTKAGFCFFDNSRSTLQLLFDWKGLNQLEDFHRTQHLPISARGAFSSLP